MPAPATIDAYLDGLEPGSRADMEAVRAAVRAGAPDAEEAIAYGMPALRVDGHFLLSYSAFKRHWSLFPASDAVIAELGAEIAPHVTGKGTLRFPSDRPVPTDLVRRVAIIRRREEAEAADARARSRPAPRRRHPSPATGENEG